MLNKSKSINVNGRSTVEVNGTETVVMLLNASITESGSVNVSKNIQDTKLYLANRETVDADAAEFETYVYGLLEV